MAHARKWEAGLEHAERVIEQLWLQKMIYALERASEAEGLDRLELYASSPSLGLDVAAFIERQGAVVELDVLLRNLFNEKLNELVLTDSGRALDDLRKQLGEIKSWTRSRPGLLAGASALGSVALRNTVVIRPRSSWRSIADAIGAPGAVVLMERAQLAEETRALGAQGLGALRV